MIRHADWIVDVGPAAGEKGDYILHSGLPDGLCEVKESLTCNIFYEDTPKTINDPRKPKGLLKLEGVTRNHLQNLDFSFPLGVLTGVEIPLADN